MERHKEIMLSALKEWENKRDSWGIEDFLNAVHSDLGEDSMEEHTVDTIIVNLSYLLSMMAKCRHAEERLKQFIDCGYVL